MRDDVARARAMMLGAALLFSTGGTVIKATAYGGWQVAGLRSLVAAIVLFLVVPETRRGWSPRVLLVSVFYAATLVLFVLANKLTTAANSIFLQSTSPLYILVVAPWWLSERLRREDLGVLGLIAVGLLLFLTSADETTAIAADPALGNLLGAASGMTWAGTVMGMRWLAQHPPPGVTASASAATSAAVGNVLAALICAPMAAWAVGGPVDWAIVGFLGVFQIGAAYLLMTRAMPHLPALTASLLLMAEPVFSAALAAGVHGEIPAPGAALGGAVILSALALQAWTARDPGTAQAAG